ncbi:superoxide dismutase [Clostridium aminobutyricum]|uniref:Superoxide dismutase n=1 Tax=Clostridium aminobutyricum TaxID=33953 RepID=A0A939IHB0_CLOAM|nr:superoxide dismutase [Clostridium aminobutyricum]MBN7773502.1 superoxide dismutase [Clostridium aminobutyricum]
MFEQVKLTYSFDALEPHIDALTMETHYTKHHATYTKNLNDVAEKANIVGQSIEDILSQWKKNASDETKAAVRNNGGGFYNHNLYFGHLAPNTGGEPNGVLAEKINQTFSSFGDFKNQISKAAIGQFGSGWAWLATNSEGNLQIMTSANQDNPLLETEGIWQPILALDVWEHAYYLKYKNLRADYIQAFFEVVNWDQVAHNYEQRRR